MTTTPLHIAMNKAVDDFGTDILKSPMLVNVLTDYHAFDVHENTGKAIKSRLCELISDGQIEAVLSWKELSEKRRKRKEKDLLKQYGNDKDVKYIIDSVLNSLELSDFPISFTPEPQPLVSSSVSAASVASKPLQPNKARKYNKLNLKNIVCALVGLLFFVPLGIYTFSQDEMGWGLLCFFSALLCMAGPFLNPDFWK